MLSYTPRPEIQSIAFIKHTHAICSLLLLLLLLLLSRKLWMQEVTTGLRQKGINNMEWID